MNDNENKVKYPTVTVKLIGTDSNVFAILGRVSGALKQAGFHDGAREFMDTATQCASYDEVLQLCMRTVDVV